MGLRDENEVLMGLREENEVLMKRIDELESAIDCGNVAGEFQKQMFVASVQPYGVNTTFVMKSHQYDDGEDSCECGQVAIVVQGEEAREKFEIGELVMVTFSKIVEVPDD